MPRNNISESSRKSSNRSTTNQIQNSTKRTAGGNENSGWKIRLNVCRSPSSDSSDHAPSDSRRPSTIALSVVDSVGYHRTINNEVIAPAAAMSLTPATQRLRTTRNSSLCPCLQQNDSEPEPADHQPAPVATPASVPRVMRASVQQQTSLINVSENVTMPVAEPYPVHTQVEYTHFLVPDLLKITNATYYWGVMDRFEAERVLENKPEGTFVLRDSAQSEYLFSVSFRRYQRTLHARIEQLNHKFSFDSYDPGVFSATSVTELIKHYEDPAKCLFFEPLLSRPLARNFAFPMQHLCRAVICDSISYNDIQYLELPKKFKDYLREYHYKQRIRIRQME